MGSDWRTPAARLFDQLAVRGIQLEAAGGRLRVHPASRLTPTERAELHALKSDMLALLARLDAKWHFCPRCGVVRPRIESGSPCSACRALDHAASMRAGWRAAVLELGEVAGWPRLPFAPGYAVATGEHAYRTFVSHAAVPSLQLVVEALRAHVATLPAPEPGHFSCTICGESGYTVVDGDWLCEQCHRASVHAEPLEPPP